ncbi:tetratricopeptide repeat protein [Dehalococcoidia bacterium]|nr:tetratricopeptide repeat protein [Dehalococcoidia bacterium]
MKNRLTTTFLLVLVVTLMVACSNDVERYYSSGTEYLAQEEYGQAIENLNETILLDPQHADAYFNRGVTYERLDKWELVEQDFQKAKELGSVP